MPTVSPMLAALLTLAGTIPGAHLPEFNYRRRQMKEPLPAEGEELPAPTIPTSPYVSRWSKEEWEAERARLQAEWEAGAEERVRRSAERQGHLEAEEVQRKAEWLAFVEKYPRNPKVLWWKQAEEERARLAEIGRKAEEKRQRKAAKRKGGVTGGIPG